jgi:hypothetical protein
MNIKIENIKENPTTILQRAGYSFQRHADNDKLSFIKPLAQGGFPRFHIYTQIKEFSLLISIHLDQKKETHGNTTRHHGEYDDTGALKKEIERIQSTIL